MLGARALASAAFCFAALAGCAGSAAKRPTEGPRAVPSPLKASVDVGAPRLVPPTTGSALTTFDTASDGSRYLISYGLRVLERPDGSMELSRDFLPTGRGANALALPERLGGGFVFYSVSSGSTLFWRARTWTAPLEPIAQIDGEMMRVIAGFDRLYLQRDRRTPWLGLDLEGPRVVDLAGLPPAPAYGVMAFADEWFGAVEVPYRGLLVTFDAGASYRPAGVNVTNLVAKDGELQIESPDSLLALGADGSLRPLDRAPSATAQRPGPAEAERRRPKLGPFGRRPLELAVLHGVAIAKERALVAAGGALGEVNLIDGSVSNVKERAYSGNGTCHGMPLGRGVGFLCSEPQGKTVVLAYVPPHGLKEVIAFDAPRYVSPNAGALAIRGSCRADGGASGMYCIVPREGAPFELRVEGDLGVERVVALEDGRAAVLIPPRLGAKGSLALIEPGGREVRATLELPKASDAVLSSLVKHGLWLNGFEQQGKDAIRGWVSGDGPIVGVRVKFDGKVEIGKVEHGGIERALISGRHALVLGRSGALVESSDGGFQWQDLELPGDPQLARQRGSLSSPTNGCSEIGCAFGGWLRVGYGKEGEDGELARTTAPKPLRVPSPGGGRWSLDCSPTGEMSPPSQPSPRIDIERSSDEPTRGIWLPFWEEAPPKLAPSEVGYDVGTESELSQMRAYAWGPSAGDWTRSGKWQVRVADRQRVGGAIWSTAVSRTPWGSSEIAADVFGYSPSGSMSAFRVLLDASGRSALLAVTSRGRSDLYLLEEGRAILPLRSSGTLGSPNAWVKLGATYYLGTTTDSRTFRVYRLDDGELVLFAEYPDLQGVFLSPTLVRDSRGEALGLLTRAANTYVSPIDPVSGQVGAPLELEAAKLASMPRACTGGEEGWLIAGPLGVEPYIDFPRQEGRVSTRGFEARLLVGEDDLCVESLSVQGDLPNTPRNGAPAAKAEGVPMVLSDRGERGRRVAYRCKN